MCFPSITVKEQGKNMLPILICAECTRPRMVAVPTPFAIPPYRRSTSRIMLHAVAHSGDMIVTCAPESTNALTLWPLTSTGMYSMVTRPNAARLLVFGGNPQIRCHLHSG